METQRFDTLARALARGRARRTTLALVGGLLAAPLLGGFPGAAKKKKTKKKKVTLCLDGQTVQASKTKKKKLIKSGATPGACPASPPPPASCIAACEGRSCGVDDGCGGTCGCAAGSICHNGVCHVCTATCGADSTICGEDLQFALSAGGIVYACPGRYVGKFNLDKSVSLIGAGQGDDPAGNTILDASGDGRVVRVLGSVTASLRGLRITGGNIPSDGGGILNAGTLTMTSCTVSANKAGEEGGGIFNAHGASGPLTLDGCTVTGNSSKEGGGIYQYNPGPFILKNSTVRQNKATTYGGGIRIYSPTGETSVDISGSSITDNSAGIQGGGISNGAPPSHVSLTGTPVSGNSAPSDPQCSNVPNC